jgi:hypothetical protein
LFAAGLLVAVGMGSASLLGVGLPGSARAAGTPPSNSSPPSISGNAVQGQTLTAASGSWNGTTPINFVYQWQRCAANGSTCGDIANATNQTYTLTSSDVGGTVRVVVTAMNTAGSGSATSAPTAVITAPGTAPANTAQPNTHGSTVVGQTVTVDTGTWAGTTPISYAYQWQRCTATNPTCANISGQTNASYTIVSADLGMRLRAIVTASNSTGSNSAPSNLSAVVTAPASAPVNTAKPGISNTDTAKVGQTVTSSNGTWTGSQPISFSYAWQRCNSQGGNCQTIIGANTTSSTYTLSQADLGNRVQLQVTAHNSTGSSTATSAQTAVVTSALPAGAITLLDGKISIPVTSVTAPERLIVSGVSFSPSPARSRTPITARFRVTDTRGYVIRDALVYALGLPYGWIQNAPETPTGTDGYAVIHLTPTANLPLQNGKALVIFVRARNPNDTLLAGVSNRRLVQLRLASP